MIINAENYSILTANKAAKKYSTGPATTSGLEAYETFCADPVGFDLVVTDMTMPDMTGLVLGKLIEIRPQVPVLLCTGYYSEKVTLETGKEIGIREVLIKPVPIGELTTSIQRAMMQGDKP